MSIERDAELSVMSPAEILRELCVPFSDDELDAAKDPHPHAFSRGHVGLFPAGEVTVTAAQGREGKTTNVIAVAVAQIIGHTLADLWPDKNRTVIVYSAEDSRDQYARKVAGAMSVLSADQAALVRERLLVPNLDDPAFAAQRSLVMLLDGTPYATATVEAIIEALRPMTSCATPLGLLVFETASTLNEAGETEPGLKALVMALKRIARELSVPVLLSHHVSQASLSSLPELNLSTADIRGSTVLIGNVRQTAMVVNLGSTEEPFPDNDARTVLRKLVAPNVLEKVTAWVSLDSSKGITPPPIFFRWVRTDYGPAAIELPAPYELQGKSWGQVQQMIRAARRDAKAEAQSERQDATAQVRQQKVVEAMARLERDGQPATARRIREITSASSLVVGQALSRLEIAGRVASYTTKAGGQTVTAYRFTQGGTNENE